MLFALSAFMLFGGRPIPKQPLAIRLLIIAVVLYAARPIIGSAFGVLGDTFAKMSARQVEAALDKHPLWGAIPPPGRNTHCEPSSRGWDYVCTFTYGVPRGGSPLRMSIDVRVGSKQISDLSAPRELSAASNGR
jgi:hypothetical protein